MFSFAMILNGNPNFSRQPLVAAGVIRSMRPADLPAVVLLEATSPSPWSTAALAGELAFPGGLQLVVDLPESGVIGWCACRLLYPEAELLKIAVAPAWRRRGLGGALLARLLTTLGKEGVKSLFLEVRGGNRTARKFYAQHGFIEVGERLHYYTDPPDRAVILNRELGNENFA